MRWPSNKRVAVPVKSVYVQKFIFYVYSSTIIIYWKSENETLNNKIMICSVYDVQCPIFDAKVIDKPKWTKWDYIIITINTLTKSHICAFFL